MQIKIKPVAMGYIVVPTNKNIVEKVDSYMLQYGIEDGSEIFYKSILVQMYKRILICHLKI